MMARVGRPGVSEAQGEVERQNQHKAVAVGALFM
jgi:hypothetical protein